MIDEATKDRIRRLIPLATKEEAERLMDILRMEAEDGQVIEDVSFLEYCRKTCPFVLDPWQEIFCAILQDAADNPGQRIQVHAPPQVGKTVLVSERFPAWLLGRNPKARFVSAAYNETHATGFGHAVKNLMLSAEHKEMFPSVMGQIGKRTSTQMFRTPAREMINDGQYSFLAVGINTGMTGKGLSAGDVMVIDDPYASDDAATSPSINERTWRFWEKTVKQRVIGATVIVVFHRYHVDDFSARLLDREGCRSVEHPKGWKVFRFPLVADDDPDKDDPTGREIGEILTPRRTLEDAKDWEEKDLAGYMGQAQGRPLTSIAMLIDPDSLRVWPEAEPPKVRFWYRGYDLALKRISPDESASVLLGVMENGEIYVDDIQHWRKDIDKTEDEIEETSKDDPEGHFVCMYNEVVQLSTIGRLKMHVRITLIEVLRRNRAKWACAAGWAAQAKRGKIWFSRSCKELPYFKVQCSRFNDLPTDRDDLIDAFSAAYESTYRHRATTEKQTERVNPDSWKYIEALRSRGKEAASRERARSRGRAF